MATMMATFTSVMAARMSSRPTAMMAMKMMTDHGIVKDPSVNPSDSSMCGSIVAGNPRSLENPILRMPGWLVMPGWMTCPHCRATVQPLTGADGNPLCPVCRNTGRPAQPAPPAAASPAWPLVQPAAGAAKAMAPGAVAALVCGILSFLLPFVGLVLGIVAIVLGAKARGKVRASQGTLSGEAMALVGLILGAVGSLFQVTVVLAAVVFVLVSNLADTSPADITFEVHADQDRLVVAAVDGHADWSSYHVSGSAGCVLPDGSVDVGDVVLCANDGTVVIERLVPEGSGRVAFEGEV